MFRMCYYRYS